MTDLRREASGVGAATDGLAAVPRPPTQRGSARLCGGGAPLAFQQRPGALGDALLEDVPPEDAAPGGASHATTS